MSVKRKIQILSDIVMSAILLFLMAYSLVGEVLHEWLGIIILLLFVIHHILNYRWLKNLTKGKYTSLRVLNTLTNLILFADMIILSISGMMLSNHIFSFLPIKSGTSWARTFHMLGSYWGFVFMALHIGFHWTMMLGMLHKADVRLHSSWKKRVIQLCCLLVSVYGVYALISRKIVDYMFLKTRFVFFNFDEKLIVFLFDYFTIMFLFATIGFWIQKFLISRHKQK